ncbi:MAG: alpha/beta hydrolase [Labilithrix sp.]|nr:alpha/beta hydrolase [Labilithrix sp.]
MTEAVLFIHSTGTSPMMWAGVPDEAIGRRDILVPANLGYPPHPVVERDRTITIDDEVEHVLSHVPPSVERLHVVAHSYGATVALSALPRLREKLASLFLDEPVLFGALEGDREIDPAIRAEHRALAEGPLFDEANAGGDAWLEAFIDYWNRPGSWARLPDVMKAHSRAMGWKMFQEVRLCFAARTPFDDYALDVPTTLVMGERTTVHSRAVTQALARRRSNVVLVEMPKTGHMAPLTHPSVVHAEIASHFARL